MDNTLTYEQLDEMKTQLIGQHSVAGEVDRVTTGAKIDLLQELMAGLKPAKPRKREYFVLYRVEWQPETEDDDAPMDREHEMVFTDDRIKTYSMVAIGDESIVTQFMGEELAQDPLYYGPEGS